MKQLILLNQNLLTIMSTFDFDQEGFPVLLHYFYFRLVIYFTVALSSWLLSQPLG